MTNRADDRPREEQEERQADELDPTRDLDLRRSGAARSANDGRPRSGLSAKPTGAEEDVDWFEDGNLALDRHELWDDFPSAPRLRLLQSPAVQVSVQRKRASVSVQPMPAPAPLPGHSRRAREPSGVPPTGSADLQGLRSSWSSGW